MYNKDDEEDQHDYSPNELAELATNHKAKHDEIVNSNLRKGDSIDKWHQRNLEHVQRHLPKHYPLEGLDGQ